MPYRLLLFSIPTLGASIAWGWLGSALRVAATFDVLPGLEVTNDGLFYVVFKAAPNGSDHVDAWLVCIFAQTDVPPVYGGQRFSNDSKSEQVEKRADPDVGLCFASVIRYIVELLHRNGLPNLDSLKSIQIRDIRVIRG